MNDAGTSGLEAVSEWPSGVPLTSTYNGLGRDSHLHNLDVAVVVGFGGRAAL